MNIYNNKYHKNLNENLIPENLGFKKMSICITESKSNQSYHLQHQQTDTFILN